MLELTGEEFTYTFKSEISDRKLEAYKQLQIGMNRAAMEFQGYVGQDLSYVALTSGNGYSCTARITFINLEFCLAWLGSSERRKVLNEAEASLGYRYDSLLEPHSFDQWLDHRQGGNTPVWKINLLVWLALYPSVMALILISKNTLGALPLPLNMLISNAITVAVTGWWLVPWLSQRYVKWLQTKSHRLNFVYTASVFGFLLLFLLVFNGLCNL